MQRNGKTEKARVEEKKTDDAQECFAVFVIDFGAWRNERRRIAGSTTKLSIAR